MMYGIVFEDAPDGGVGAFLPDMPGVAVIGVDRAEAFALLDRAVRLHVAGMIEDGDPLPNPTPNRVRYQSYIDVDQDELPSFGRTP